VHPNHNKLESESGRKNTDGGRIFVKFDGQVAGSDMLSTEYEKIERNLP
jgi:hypothetical protein